MFIKDSKRKLIQKKREGKNCENYKNNFSLHIVMKIIQCNGCHRMTTWSTDTDSYCIYDSLNRLVNLQNDRFANYSNDRRIYKYFVLPEYVSCMYWRIWESWVNLVQEDNFALSQRVLLNCVNLGFRPEKMISWTHFYSGPS